VVEGGCPEADDHLVGIGPGVGDLLEREDIRRPECMQHDGSHLIDSSFTA
jgi:hypothetical protein